MLEGDSTLEQKAGLRSQEKQTRVKGKAGRPLGAHTVPYHSPAPANTGQAAQAKLWETVKLQPSQRLTVLMNY